VKPKQFFFIMLGILVLALGAGGYGYKYALAKMKTDTGGLAEKMAEEVAAQQQMEKLDKLRHDYNRDIVPILSLIDNALPRDKKQTEILAQIERIAIDTGVVQPFQSVTMPSPAGLPSDVSQTIKAGVVLALPINFTAEGTYAQLQQFTSRLETLNRYTDVTSLAIKADVKGPTKKYVFTINAYIKP